MDQLERSEPQFQVALNSHYWDVVVMALRSHNKELLKEGQIACESRWRIADILREIDYAIHGKVTKGLDDLL